jgi:hypothetical protein
MNIDKESSFLSILLFKEKFVYEKRRFLQHRLKTFRINTLQLHLHAQNKKRRTQGISITMPASFYPPLCGQQ